MKNYSSGDNSRLYLKKKKTTKNFIQKKKLIIDSSHMFIINRYIFSWGHFKKLFKSTANFGNYLNFMTIILQEWQHKNFVTKFQEWLNTERGKDWMMVKKIEM